MRLARQRGLPPRLLMSALLVGFGIMLSQPAPAEPPAEHFSAHGCNTRCQSGQTDCAVRCDGEIPCIQTCQKLADSCVEKCQAPLTQ